MIQTEFSIRINLNQSEVKNRSNLIRFNPRRQSEWIRNQILNPNQSEVWLIQNEFSIRINSNHFNHGFIRIDYDWKFGFGSFRPWIDSDWKSCHGLVRIHSDSCLGLNRIRSDRFFTIFKQTSYKTFFGLIRNDSHWLGYRYRNESESIPIRYFRQGSAYSRNYELMSCNVEVPDHTNECHIANCNYNITCVMEDELQSLIYHSSLASLLRNSNIK